MCVILIVKCHLNVQNIRFRIFRDSHSQLFIANTHTLDEDCVFIFSELDPKVFAVRFRALEIPAIDVNLFIVWALNRSINRKDWCDLWCIVILIGVVLTWDYQCRLPVLLIEREFKNCLGIKIGCRCFPIEALTRDINSECNFSNHVLSNWISESDPYLRDL